MLAARAFEIGFVFTWGLEEPPVQRTPRDARKRARDVPDPAWLSLARLVLAATTTAAGRGRALGRLGEAGRAPRGLRAEAPRARERSGTRGAPGPGALVDLPQRGFPSQERACPRFGPLGLSGGFTQEENAGDQHPDGERDESDQAKDATAVGSRDHADDRQNTENGDLPHRGRHATRARPCA